jgi:thiamine-monophosphate kinase
VAAIDLSDGFARDLHRLCRESGVAADVDAAALPLAPGHAALARAVGSDPLALALGGGEDYVLLFALPDALVPPAGWRCHRVGVVTTGRRLRLRVTGRWRPLPDVGFDHLSPRAGGGR